MRFLVGDTGDSSPGGVIRGALSALYDACKNQERNRDAFIYSNMAEVRTAKGLLRGAVFVDALFGAAWCKSCRGDHRCSKTHYCITGEVWCVISGRRQCAVR